MHGHHSCSCAPIHQDPIGHGEKMHATDSQADVWRAIEMALVAQQFD